MRVARVDGEPPELRQVFAVARALEGLLDARIRTDVADRGDDEGRAGFAQRAQRNLTITSLPSLRLATRSICMPIGRGLGLVP